MGEIENKDQLSPTEVEIRTEFGNKNKLKYYLANCLNHQQNLCGPINFRIVATDQSYLIEAVETGVKIYDPTKTPIEAKQG